jgi:hypothetical protein
MFGNGSSSSRSSGSTNTTSTNNATTSMGDSLPPHHKPSHHHHKPSPHPLTRAQFYELVHHLEGQLPQPPDWLLANQSSEEGATSYLYNPYICFSYLSAPPPEVSVYASRHLPHSLVCWHVNAHTHFYRNYAAAVSGCCLFPTALAAAAAEAVANHGMVVTAIGGENSMFRLIPGILEGNNNNTNSGAKRRPQKQEKEDEEKQAGQDEEEEEDEDGDDEGSLEVFGVAEVEAAASLVFDKVRRKHRVND